MVLIFLRVAVLACSLVIISTTKDNVHVFHYTINYWAESVEGVQQCGPDMHCQWTYSDDLNVLRSRYLKTEFQPPSSTDNGTVTLGVYNIHSWWERHRQHGPSVCELPTNMTLAESEESRVRYHMLFDPTFKLFDGYSTTHPTSHVQRVYESVFINASHFLNHIHPFSNLIKGAAYVASDCHKRDSANANRDHIVWQLRKAGFRVDGLGRCMHQLGPEGVTLPTNKEARYDLTIKRKAIARFMFNMAFENSIEPGYVTEKPFDALISGTVPVYLGDASHLKALLPHPKAAIFVADFPDITALAKYLTYLTTNETAYEEHRAWRNGFTHEENIKNKPLLQSSWYCRVCSWAAENAWKYKDRKRTCDKSILKEARVDLDGKAVRGAKGKQMFYVKDGALHLIPDMNTFKSLSLDMTKVVVLNDGDIKRMPLGAPLPYAKPVTSTNSISSSGSSVLGSSSNSSVGNSTINGSSL